MGDLDAGRFLNSLGIHLGAPASIGGLRVVLVAGAYTGDDPAVTFVDGTPIFTLWPFFPPLDPSRTLGNGNTPPPDPTAPTEVKYEVLEFLIPDPSDPVLGSAFAVATDGSEASTDQLIVHSGSATSALFFEEVAGGDYRAVARARLRPAPLIGRGGRTLVLAISQFAIPADGSASLKLGNITPIPTVRPASPTHTINEIIL